MQTDMDCEDEAEDSRATPCQTGIRSRTSMEVVGERAGCEWNADVLQMRQGVDNQFI